MRTEPLASAADRLARIFHSEDDGHVSAALEAAHDLALAGDVYEAFEATRYAGLLYAETYGYAHAGLTAVEEHLEAVDDLDLDRDFRAAMGVTA